MATAKFDVTKPKVDPVLTPTGSIPVGVVVHGYLYSHLTREQINGGGGTFLIIKHNTHNIPLRLDDLIAFEWYYIHVTDWEPSVKLSLTGNKQS